MSAISYPASGKHQLNVFSCGLEAFDLLKDPGIGSLVSNNSLP
ncbi:hypothetical protein HanIR_Chr17g0885821 [Helianthus annuus]|nr:hypothetical protein HanIR_Chr17g0885821 [Helianthus annuus]